MYNINKYDLENFYKEHSVKECSLYFKVSINTIYNYLNKYNIDIKKTQLDLCPNELSEIQKQIFLGSMLGDGSVSKKYMANNCLYSERHSLSQLPYLQYKFDILKPFSRKITHEIIKSNFKSSKKNYYSVKMETVRSKIFTQYENFWYKRDDKNNYIFNNKGKRIKIIPKTFKELTPLILTIWYCDDGRITPTRKCCYLSTDGFEKQEVEFLCDLLKLINIKSNPVLTRRKNYEIYISTKSYLNFLNIMEPHIPCECVKYKYKTIKEVS